MNKILIYFIEIEEYSLEEGREKIITCMCAVNRHGGRFGEDVGGVLAEVVSVP